MIWSLDRLSREGISPMTRYMDRLRAASVRVMSHEEPWLDTGGPVGELLIAIFGWVAQQERQRIGERVRSGQARAKVQGTRSGRPFGRPPRVVDLEDLRRRREMGQGWRKIARGMRTPTSTLRRRWKESQKSSGELLPPTEQLAGTFAGPEGRPIT